MTSVRTFSFFGKISDRDHFDQLTKAIETTVRLSQDGAEYLIEAATSGKPVSIMGGNRSRFSPIADACEEAGLPYNVTELDESNTPVRRECWRPGAARPFLVELTRLGEPAFTGDQITDAMRNSGDPNAVNTLMRWANADKPATLEIEADLMAELRGSIQPRR